MIIDYQILLWNGIDIPYVQYTPVTDSMKKSKRIVLLEDDISVTYFMEKLGEKKYKYIKHSHTTWWQYVHFKQSRDVFSKGTILSVVDFAENYTLTSQKEIQSEYYHSYQVSIIVNI